MNLAYKFDWSVLYSPPYSQWLIDGVIMTLFIGSLAMIISFFLGVFIGTLRVTKYKALRFLGTAYVELFRNIPLLVQMFFWYFAGPMLLGDDWGRQVNRLSNLNIIVSIIGLGLYTASRVAEHVRAGFASINKEQYQAVLSTGMTQTQMYRHVIVPYALRLTIPPLTTEFLTVYKNTSICMTIGVAEVTFQSAQIEADTFHGLEATTGAMLIYLVIGYTVIKLMSLVEAKYKIQGLMGR